MVLHEQWSWLGEHEENLCHTDKRPLKNICLPWICGHTPLSPSLRNKTALHWTHSGKWIFPLQKPNPNILCFYMIQLFELREEYLPRLARKWYLCVGISNIWQITGKSVKEAEDDQRPNCSQICFGSMLQLSTHTEKRQDRNYWIIKSL